MGLIADEFNDLGERLLIDRNRLTMFVDYVDLQVAKMDREPKAIKGSSNDFAQPILLLNET